MVKSSFLSLLFLNVFQKIVSIPFSNCFFGVIHDKPESFDASLDDMRYIAFVEALKTFSQNQWIFYSVQNLNFDNNKKSDSPKHSMNITISSGYFRFVNKLKTDFCTAFLLLTTTLKNTVSAIHRSGFHSSEYVIFLIPVKGISETSSKLVHGFKHQLISPNTKFKAFSATSVFYIPLLTKKGTPSEFGVLCFACMQQPNPVIQITASHFHEILSKSEIINVNMRKNTIHVKNSFALESDTDCLQVRSPFVSYKTYHSFVPCAYWQTGWAAFGHYINATFVSSKYRMNQAEVLHGSWLTKLFLEISEVHRLPEDFALNRGLHSAFASKETRLLACVYAKSLAMFDTSLERLIPLDISGCIALCIGFYIAVYGNIKAALNLTWHFLGLPAEISRRARKTSWITVALAGTVAWCWQAYVSADALAFQRMPSETKLLVKMQYKIWIPMKWVNYWKATIGGALFETYTHGLLENIYHDMDRYPKPSPWNLTETFYTMALEKRTFWNIQSRLFLLDIWSRQVMLDSIIVCQALPYDRIMTSYYYRVIRVSGTSAKAKKIVRRWIDVGLALSDKIYERSLTHLLGTGITPLHKALKPLPLTILGVLGTCVILMTSAQSLILLIWLIWNRQRILGIVNWNWNIFVWNLTSWRRRILIRLGNM